ncbi:uncharacterized protein LOC116030173 [Ipomoea triloba]|uniref:uncharacterized protein LOC116030173 n=1 Tax=Ipomoea triloba TaxID=35885 RepID=UPI00125DFA40|nr:uncharacterized protein LOC116030173 [Ipomoea triloba]
MAAGTSRKISAASARSHTRKSKQKTSLPLPSGLFGKILLVSFIGFLAWAYQATRPPAPKLCGSPDGPPITAPRIKLSDGRYLAYKEHGVPKDKAAYKIVYVHGFDSCRHDAVIANNLSPDVIESLGVYIVSFDRPGYGESDPNPKRTEKGIALDIEELADALGLGSKFYVVGFSMGGQVVWTCLKYIPHRLAGASLIAPVINHWWPNIPANLSKQGFSKHLPQDQWALGVAHYAPWLVHWWETQKYFPALSVSAHSRDILSSHDLELLPKIHPRRVDYMAQVRQQGEFESLHRDLIVGFGTWEFGPTDLKNPFPNGEGSVHLWHGEEDRLVPVAVQRYITQQLPWIHYHELQDGPPITAPRIKLSDGRYLAYKEHGVPKDKATYKIVYVHGYDSCRHDPAIANNLSPDVIESLRVYVVSFDRPGYGESDPNPKRTEKGIALDIEELADALGLGSKFYVVGFSMGGQVVWTCLKYIPHRLAGASLIAPVINHWWPNIPANLSKHGFSKHIPKDQWALGVAHYAPWLIHWWETRKYFPALSVSAHSQDNLSSQDIELLPNIIPRVVDYMAQVRQQGEFESLHRDLIVGFGTWEFGPTDLKNPFPNGEGSVHLWHGEEDCLVPIAVQRYITQQLPWIHYHELQGAGHLFPHAYGMADRIVKSLLIGENSP